MTLTPTLTDFIQRTGVAMQGYIPRAAAEVFALLVIADEPLTADQIACVLRHSRAGVNASIRILESHDVVQRVARAGDRRDRYTLPADAFQRLLARVSHRLRELASIAGEAAAGSPRLTEMNTTFQRASASLDQWRHS
jgi:DNA-binding transcriptional regulator GbsR (MarR family)